MHSDRHAIPVGRSRPHRRALSLIEVLVVVAVIAVLVGLATAGFAGSRATARRTACLAQLKGFGVAFTLYRDTYQDLLPPARFRPDLRTHDVAPYDALGTFVDAPLPSIRGSAVVTGPPYRCPSDREYAPVSGFSYHYAPADLMGSLPPALHRRVSDLWTSNPQAVLLFDAMKAFHGPPEGSPEGAGTIYVDRNVLRSDGVAEVGSSKHATLPVGFP